MRNIILNKPALVGDSPWNPRRVAEETMKDPDLRRIVEKKTSVGAQPEWEEVAGESPQYKGYLAQWDRLIVKDGRLFRVWWDQEGKPVSLQLAPPQAYRQSIMEIAHSGYGGGHVGVRKTKAKVAKKA